MAHFNTKHGHRPFGKMSPTYAAWRNMLNRCYYKRSRSYLDYGGRGIEVCPQWRDSFTAFLADVGERPSKQYSLDRKDSNGDYEPGNVRWATRIEQAQNKRTNKLSVALVQEIRGRYEHGESQVSIAKRVGVSQPMISKVVRNEMWVE